ncbi:HAD-IA family hydrolase [Streptomyces sp. SID5785]|uniref:HAD family hydrolase n=1 Tax=Streptomyces sp. SID5785 TaxID=2690309 RepID=UPI001361572B|nr:HAD-IA family hydrolase [Streptomyces sp. SID5785]MZD07970.1 HAD-IA family hydrolase [Streptomyces sp. SID5785]MZD08593.1 HAD-IA family hydrolase [Streptomyces sp. SID5785]
MTTDPPPSGRPFDAVLCDLDNVIRFYDMSRVSELERRAGLAEGTTARVAYAPEVDLPLLLGRITTQVWTESIEHGLMRDVSPSQARELATAFARAPFRVDDDVVALLTRARGHVPLVLVTNATLDLERDLESLGLSELADHVVSSARVGVAKPDPAIYGIAVERAGTVAARCLFVDDRRENVEAAAALGMTGVHYGHPGDLREALSAVLSD